MPSEAAPIQGAHSRVALYAIAHAVITLAISVAPALVDERAEDMVRPLSTALLLLCIWSLISARAALGRLFGPYGLFLISAFLFNAGQPMLDALGLTPAIGMLNGL